MRGRIGGLEADEAAALRVQQHDARGEHVREGRLERREIRVAAERGGGEQDLQVGQRRLGARLQERDDAARHVGGEAGAEEIGLRERARDAVGAHGAQERARLLAPVHQDHRDMVLQVLADARQRDLHRNAHGGASSSGSPMPDSIRSCGELMTPPARITSRSARAATVSAALPVFDADGAASLEEDARGQRLDRRPSGSGASAPGADRRSRRCSAGRCGSSSAGGRSLPAGRRCSRRSTA